MQLLVDVVVIGAGQAGLSAALPPAAARIRAGHAATRARPRPSSCSTPNAAPGRRVAAPLGVAAHGDRERHPRAAGLSRCRRPIRMRRAATCCRPTSREYERALRPRRAAAGARARRAPRRRRPDGRLLVETDRGQRGRRATSSTRPARGPARSGRTTRGIERFRGRQLHVADYVSADEFAGKRVVIVGAGISAVQLLDEISHVAETFWVTRREPDWSRRPLRHPRAQSRRSPASRTGCARACRRAASSRSPACTGPRGRARRRQRGVLVRHPMFASIEEDGVRMPDGSFVAADVILWATGFRPARRPPRAR